MTQTEIFSFVVQTLYWFFLYGCIGWGVEVVYAAIKERRLVNRGFLCGPICPIYGCGMVVLNWTVAALAPSGEGKSVSTVAVFFVGMVLTTAIELVGGWTLFKIYHIRWWDYSNMKFNIGGYICPQFSLLWGLGSVIMVKVVHPALAKASSPLPMKVLVPAEAAVLALFVVDLIVSAAAATGLNKKLKEIDEVRARLRVTSDKLTTVLGVSAMTADTILDEQKLQLALAKLEGRENAAELKLEMLLRANEMRAKLRDISVDKIGTRRLLRAFPDMKSLTYAETLASTRAGVRRLNELAAAARTAAKEMAQTAKETADTILDEQKLQLALAKLEGRENAAELKLEMLLRANEMRAKLRDISVDKIGTRRLLRAFPDMKSLTYAETLASTRAGVRRLNELAAAARTAAKEMAQTAKETAQTAVGTAAAAAQTAKETAANAAQSAAQTAKEAAASAIQTARETGISTPQSTKPAKDEPGQ